ncbi:MAG TPA: ABC transporter transmembrane domain-containing protein, partial [Streptosporangiaceae bacterium]|nr:ABC transporter transmembrane domain-containing protein [Streptosporangiaceae bacterium]
MRPRSRRPQPSGGTQQPGTPGRPDERRRPTAPAPTLGSGYGEGWLRRLAGYCWRHKALTLVALGASLLSTLVTTAIPLIQRNIIDNSIVKHTQPVWPGATALLIAAAISFGAVYLRRYRGGQLSLDVQHDLRTELFGSLSRLDGVRQDQLHTGQIVSRSISDLNMIQSLLQMLPMLLGSGILFVLSLVVMFVLSPLLALISLAVGPVLLVLSVASRRRLFPASWDAQQKAGEVAGVVEGAVTGVRVVKGFGQENQEIERLESISRVLYAARVRAVLLMAKFSPALGAIPALGQVGVLALGGWLAIKGSITLGTFLAFAAYLAQMVNPVRALTGLITIGQEARASVIRVFEVIDSRPVITEKPDAVALWAGSHDIELDDVYFGYVPSQPVLRGLSLRVRPGETLAVVGTSGSGKSTISLLVPRFYDVRGGGVRVSGHDVRDLTIDSLRASIGLVLEESFLFSDTVRNNIAYGRPDATQRQIEAAARAAEAEEFILDLPDGYETVVGEQGLTLSGGQRQRVALARALITDPSILILDDATSAIDARIEAQIHATLRKVMAGRTTLLIAHRRSTLELADRIAVLDEGRLVDEGTHDELTLRCPEYRLLLAGPGDDAEGVDAGEIDYYRNEAAGVAATGSVAADPRARGITPSLWPDIGPALASDTVGRDQVARTAAAGIGRGLISAAGGGRGGGAAQRGAALTGGAAGGGWLAGVPASPELVAKVAALPPADESPRVDQAFARAPAPNFTLRRLLRPFAIALLIGLILDALDAIASTVMPLLVRGGIDNGVERTALSVGARFQIILLVSAIGLAIVLADWVVNWQQTIVVGRNGERLLYTLRVKIFAHLQRLGLDFYERELTGRIMTRMTTDVDALSSFFQTGLITMVNSVLTF